MEPYRSGVPNTGAELRRTERLTDRVLVLPTGTAVTEDNVTVICSVILCTLKDPLALRFALQYKGSLVK